MKRFLTLTAVLCLVFLPALADSAEAQPATTLCDFGDFTWELDNEIAGSIGEKTENAAFIALYPTYVEEEPFHSNLNCVWTKTQIDVTELSESDISLLAQNVLNGMVSQYDSLGYDAKAGSVISASVMDNDEWGKPVLTIISNYQIDLFKTGEFIELHVAQVYVGGTFGTYIFTATANDFADNFMACISLLDQIAWVN